MAISETRQCYITYHSCDVECNLGLTFNHRLREAVKKKHGYFTVRLTVRVDPPPLTVSCFVFFSEVYI